MVNLGKVQTGVSYKRIVIVFLILAVFLVLFIGYATLSQATVHITPARVEKEVALDVTVDASAPEVHFGDKLLPGKVLTNTLELRDTFPVAEQGVPTFAAGTVTLVNKRPSEQSLLAGTHLRAESALRDNGEPVYYLLDDRAVIPANGTVEASVTAEFKGEDSNLPPGRLIIDRLNQSAWDVVYAENSAPLTGGSVQGTILTEEQVDEARDSLRARAHTTSLETLNADLPEDERVSEHTSVAAITQASVDAEPGDSVDSFTLSATVTTTAFSFSQNNLLALAVDGFGDMETENEEYRDYIEESLTTTVRDVDVERGIAHITLTLTGLFDVHISQKAFDAEAIAGMTGEEVVEYYRQLDNIRAVQVDFWPFWVQRVPTWTHNINIQID